MVEEVGAVEVEEEDVDLIVSENLIVDNRMKFVGALKIYFTNRHPRLVYKKRASRKSFRKASQKNCNVFYLTSTPSEALISLTATYFPSLF